jgi:hypothetical protein
MGRGPLIYSGGFARWELLGKLYFGHVQGLKILLWLVVDDHIASAIGFDGVTYDLTVKATFRIHTFDQDG